MKSKRKKISKILLTLLLIMGMLLILFPMYLVIITALKSPEETAKSFFALPKTLYLNNFITVFTKADFLTALGNSAYITLLSSVVLVLFIPMISYSIARNFHRPFYKFIYILFTLGMFVPFQVVMLPQIQILQKFNLMSGNGLILIYAAISLIGNVFLIVGYIRSIPTDMEEAAYIDGASVVKTFFCIVFPLIRPITATVLIMHILFVWNDYLLPLLVLNKDKALYTLPLFQMSFKSQYAFDYNTVFAAYFISISLVTIVYVVLQKHIIGGLMLGAVKN